MLRLELVLLETFSLTNVTINSLSLTEAMDPTMADSMGLDPGGPGDGLDATVGYAGGADMSVNIGQVSSSMGTGTSAVSAIGTAADTSAAATEAGTGIAGAAMGAAVSAQGAAIAA